MPGRIYSIIPVPDFVQAGDEIEAIDFCLHCSSAVLHPQTPLLWPHLMVHPSLLQIGSISDIA